MGIFFSTHLLLLRHTITGLAASGLVFMFSASSHLAIIVGVLLAVALIALTGTVSFLAAFSMEGVVFGRTGLLLTDMLISAGTAMSLLLLITPLLVRLVLVLLILACTANVAFIVRNDDKHASSFLAALSALPGIGLSVSGIAALIGALREHKAEA